MGDVPEPDHTGKEPEQDPITHYSPHLRKVLRQISRSRTRLLVCLGTLPVYMIAVWFLLENQRSVDSFMFMYMAVWSGFAVDMARRRCPNCGQQFFVKIVFLNLITRRCVHCSLALDAPTEEQVERRKF